MKGTLRKLGVLSGERVDSFATRRGIVLTMLGGLGAVTAAAVAGFRFAPGIFDNRGYKRVAAWKFPGSEGMFIATGPHPTVGQLRALGAELQREFHDRKNMVVMIFDDARAAREVSRGSRNVGEEKFQAALAHQRAMYFKDAARKEHNLIIYSHYPVKREVIQL